MISLDRLKKIILLAMPIIGGMLSQNILNLIDTAMISHKGNVALAAVGLGGFLYWLSQALLIGLSSAIQTITARRVGQKREGELGDALVTGLAAISGVGIILSVVMLGLSPIIMPLFTLDSAVVSASNSYFGWRILGLLATGINFGFRGYWNGIKRPMVYLVILIGTHLLNVFFNWLLIFGRWGFPEMGIDGAGLASTIALWIGAAVYTGHGLWHFRAQKRTLRPPTMERLRGLVRLALPIGVQNALYSGGWMVFMAIIGRMGTQELAIANVLINLILIAILPGIGFGMAALTLVSQSLGENNRTAAKKWAWDVVKVAATTIFMVGLVTFFIPETILGVFIKSKDTLAKAILPLRIDCLMIWIEVVGLVLQQALHGAGNTRLVMTVSIASQWLLLLPAVYLIGPVMGLGLVFVWASAAVYQLIHTTIYVVIWHKSHWGQVKV